MKRAAIYTRSATVQNHDQRQQAEDYVAKMGWYCILNRYDDNGYSGFKYDRPALRERNALREAS